MEKVKFPGYTNKQKGIMQNVLMHSPHCWKDGMFKFDRTNKQVEEICKFKNCFQCMFDEFDISREDK